MRKRGDDRRKIVTDILQSCGTALLIVNQTDSDYKQEIIDYLIAVTIPFSSHLYGKRKGINKAQQIKQQLLEE